MLIAIYKSAKVLFFLNCANIFIKKCDSREIGFCKILNSSYVCRNLLLHHFKIPPRPIGKEFAGPYILYNRFLLEISRPRYCEISNNVKPKLNFYA